MVSSEEICDLICENEPNWCLLKQRLLKVDNLDRKSWGPIHPTSEGKSYFVISKLVIPVVS